MNVRTVHASAVLVGARAVLIRGPAGSGKSHLAWSLLQAAAPAFARLVCDDRAYIEAAHGRLVVRPPTRLAGLLEVRGLGIRRLPFEPLAVAGWVVDLAVEGAARLPPPGAGITLEGVTLPHLVLRPCADAAPVVLAAIRTEPALT